MAHTCHATGCETRVPPEMLMCRKHWLMVSKRLRTLVLKYYRPGQCDDWLPSSAYCGCAAAAVEEVARAEGIQPDVKLYDMLRAAAIAREYGEAAVQKSQGD